MQKIDFTLKSTQYELIESNLELKLGKLYNIRFLNDSKASEALLIRKISLKGVNLSEYDRKELVSILQSEYEVMSSDNNNIVKSFECFYDEKDDEWNLLVEKHDYNFTQFVLDGRKLDFSSTVARESSLRQLLVIIEDVAKGL